METVGWLWVIPTNLQFNPYNPQNYFDVLWSEEFAGFDLPHYLKTGKTRWLARGLSEWSFPENPKEGDTITLTAPKHPWHNGDSVTADDLYTKMRMESFFNAKMYDFLKPESLKKVDDKSVELEVSTAINRDLLKHYVFGTQQNTKASRYDKHLEKLETAKKEGRKALEMAKNDVLNYAPSSPIGTGWGKVTKKTSQEIIYEPYDKHPVGKKANYDQWVMKYSASNQKKWEFAMGQKVDLMESGTPINIVKKLVNQRGFDMMRFHYLSGLALNFNQKYKPFKDVRVRKAIAHAVDQKDAVIPIKGEWGQVRTVVEAPTGVFVNQDEWLGDDTLTSFSRYSPEEANAKKAAALLREAGYSKKDGVWAKNGDVLKLPLKVHGGYSEFVKASQSIQEDLKAADFDVQLIALSSSKIWTQINNGNYKFSTGNWGMGWHPYFGSQVMTPPTSKGGAGTQALNYPATVEVPMPVGDPAGKTKTLNVRELRSDLATASSRDDAKKAVKTLAWVYNQTLPQVPIWRRYGQMFLGNQDAWDWPSMKKWDTYLYLGIDEIFQRGLVSSETK